MSQIKPQLRELEIEDIPQAAALVRRVFMEYNAPSYEEKGVKTFLSFITEDNVKEQMQKHGMRLFGAYRAGARRAHQPSVYRRQLSPAGNRRSTRTKGRTGMPQSWKHRAFR